MEETSLIGDMLAPYEVVEENNDVYNFKQMLDQVHTQINKYEPIRAENTHTFLLDSLDHLKDVCIFTELASLVLLEAEGAAARGMVASIVSGLKRLAMTYDPEKDLTPEHRRYYVSFEEKLEEVESMLHVDEALEEETKDAKYMASKAYTMQQGLVAAVEARLRESGEAHIPPDDIIQIYQRLHLNNDDGYKLEEFNVATQLRESEYIVNEVPRYTSIQRMDDVVKQFFEVAKEAP